MDATVTRGHPVRLVGRRAVLLGLGAAWGLGGARLAFAAPRLGRAGEKRLVVVLLRGALDGLAAVQPYGDSGLAALRAPLLLPEPGQPDGVLDLGGFFGLHPALTELHRSFAAGEALVVHAVAGPWRNRSHFASQDLLESGAEQRLASGWLNRALGALPPPERVAGGIALGGAIPLLLRGATPVGAVTDPRIPPVEADVMGQLATLYRGDPQLAAPFAEGLRTRGYARETLPRPDAASQGGFAALAEAAGRLLAAADGPRIAALDLGGWDTHIGQGTALPRALANLDAGLAALRAGLGAAWPQTAVLVLTGFGRTARVNGNAGTDHGTAGVAFLLGGAIAGGRVLADWPGLATGALFENRDLAPTLDLRAVIKGVLAGHLRLPPAAIEAAFPGSAAVPPMGGLLRA